MKSLIILAFAISTTTFGSAKIKHPTKVIDGFKNVNGRQIYSYHGEGNEEIWHEFGRPFWKAKESAKSTQITQITKTKSSSVVKPVLNKDTDRDGVWDRADQCPQTKANTPVNALGCAKVFNKNLSLDVKFELNKSQIKKDYTSAIDKLGQALKENSNLKIEIQGHTCNVGSTEYNKILSSSRSEAVKNYLMENYGISNERLSAKGFGQLEPIANNQSRDGRKLNRRVDIKIIQ